MNTVYDEIRQCNLPATPEEIIRQNLVHLMIKQLGFPKGCIAIEKQLSELPHLQNRKDLPERRVDILCFDKGITPLLLIECKEGKIGPKAIEQVLGYNYYVQAQFVALAGSEGNQLIFPCKLPFLPSFSQLLNALNEFTSS